MKDLVLNSAEVEKLLQYLMNKPWKEVNSLIAMISRKMEDEECQTRQS